MSTKKDLELEFNSMTGGLLEEDDSPESEYLAPVEEYDEEYLEEDERFEPYISICAASVEYLQRGDIRQMMDECLAEHRTDLAHYVLEYHPDFEQDLRQWLDYDRFQQEDDRPEEDDRSDEDEQEADDRSDEEDVDPSFVAAIETIVRSVPPAVAAMSIEPLLQNKGYKESGSMVALITGGADVLSVLRGHNPLEEELEEAIESFSPALKELMHSKWEAIVSILFSTKPKPAAPKAKRKTPTKGTQRSSGEGSAKAQLLQLMKDDRRALIGNEWANICVQKFGRVASTYTVQLSSLKTDGLVVQEGKNPEGIARYRAK